MTTPAHFADYYAVRASLAFILEEDTRKGNPTDHASLKHYDTVDAEILQHARDYAAIWQHSRATPVLDWCSVCGNAEQERLPGHNACVVCEACIIQPDTHCMLHGTENCRLCATEREGL